jgi:DNA-binding transcriptional MerR regulator
MAEGELQLIPISRAARMLGVHPNTLRAWADRGLVPVTRLPSGYRRFSAEQIEQIRTNMLQLKLPEQGAPKAAA